MADQAKIDRIVARVGDLPAMPGIVSEVLRITDDPKATMEEASDAIQADPALAAKILRVSNSSYYGMKQYVGTLKLSLVILGVREVRNIVLGIGVFETLKDEGVNAKLTVDIWNDSLLLGGMAKKLGERLALGLQGEEFICGLLADIGKMVFLKQCGDSYASVLKECQAQPELLCENEIAEFGCTHADVAMALANQWSLPKSLADALWFQYPAEDQPLDDATDPQLGAVVRIARSASLDDFEGEGPYRSLEATESWDALAGVKAPIEVAERKDTLAGFLDELKNAPALQL